MDAHEEKAERLGRALLSLEGLSCGDAFGKQFFSMTAPERRATVRTRVLPPGTWGFTDDTMMAISVFEMLRRHGEIREDLLAAHFASLYDPLRGYGAAMHGLLLRILVRGGQAWEEEAGALFGETGSYGNGSAMRVAPIGAYFGEDLREVAEQAKRSAVATHTHAEAIAGAIGVAVGAALAWRSRDSNTALDRREFLEAVLSHVPEGEVHRGIVAALRLPEKTTALEAGLALGNGSRVTAADTVPFVLWAAGTYIDGFEEAMWQTASASGDTDTTCAMVGGIVVLRTGLADIPDEWRRRRESFAVLLENKG